MKFGITDGASVGASFTFLNAQAADIITGDIQGQAITIGISLIIGIIAKLVSQFIGSWFSRKKVTKDDVLETIRDSIKNELDKKGIIYTPEELEKLVTSAATKVSKKIIKQ